MNQKINQKGFIQILLLVIIVSFAVISTGAYGGFEYHKTSKILKEAEQLTKEEKYEEAIGKLESVQNKWLIKSLGVKKQEIANEIEKNKKLFEDKSEYTQGVEELNKGNLEEAKELLSKVSENFPYYQDAKNKIEEAQKKITEKQIAKAVEKAREEAKRETEEERARRIAAETQLEFERQLSQQQITELQRQREEAEKQRAEAEMKRTIEEKVLRIGNLLQDFFNEVRNEYMPKEDLLSLLLNLQDQREVEFAAQLAKHAIGKYNWPIQDSKYYSRSGRHSYEDTKDQLDTIVIGLWPVGIYPPTDYGVIQYLLDFFHSHIHYEHDMNQIFRAPAETLGLKSGDCDDYSILVSAALVDTGIDSSVMFVTNRDRTQAHAMVLFQSEEIFPGLYYYSDLTSFGLPSGKWYILEPQFTLEGHQQNPDCFKKWDIVVAALVGSPY